MKRHTSRHSVLAALLVVAVILVAGSAAIASNAGFKFNMPITLLDGSGGQQGHNWVGLPYFSPYTLRDDLCTACGLTFAQAGISTFRTDDKPVGSRSAGIDQQQCGFANDPTNSVMIAAEGIRIIQPAGHSGNCIVVGSHDPTLSISLAAPPISGLEGAFVAKKWFSVPYHSTAVTRDDLCQQLGLSNGTSWLTSISPFDGAADQQVCGFAGAQLILGQALLVHGANAPLSFTPAHF